MRLRSLPTGGATPLAAGILKALEVLQSERARSAETIPWLVLVTDGRGNVGVDGGLGSSDAIAAARRVKSSGVHAVVLDTSPSGRGAAARDLAEAAGADYVSIKVGDTVTLVTLVRERVLGPK
jgi:magnesium chelatase subunit D